MKKRSSLFIGVAGMILAGASLSGCVSDDPNPITSKEFTGITFEGATVTYDGQAHALEVAGAPEGATIVYSEGGNSFTDVGEYEITVTVSKDGYNDFSDSAKLTIEAADIQGLSMTNKTVNFNGEAQTIEVTGLPQGATVEYTQGKASGALPGTYTIEATVKLANHKDAVLSAQLTINPVEAASSKMVVDDFEGIGNSGLASAWELKKFDSGWKDTSATCKVANNGVFGEGTETMNFGIWNNSTVFKATKSLEFETYKKYSGFSIDTYPQKATGEIDVQFWFNKEVTLYAGGQALPLKGQYLTYRLTSEAPAQWTHWEIPFDDSTLKISDGTLQPAALGAMGLSVSDIMLFADEVAVIAKTKMVGSGEQFSLFLDNIELNTVTARKEQAYNAPKTYAKKFYIWNGDNDHYVMEASSDFADIKLTKTDGQYFEGSGTLAGTTLSVSVGEGALTFDVDVSDQTNMTVGNVGGTYGTLLSASLNGKTLKQAAPFNLDFEDGTTGSKYSDSKWVEKKYTSTWEDVTPLDMNCRSDSSNSKVVNLVSGYGYTKTFTYTPQLPLGPVNHLKIDMGHYYSASVASEIKYKISFVKSDGSSQVYLAGDANNFASIAKDTTKGDFLNHYEFTCNNVAAYKIKITVQASGQGDSYLYIDNISADLIEKAK